MHHDGILNKWWYVVVLFPERKVVKLRVEVIWNWKIDDCPFLGKSETFIWLSGSLEKFYENTVHKVLYVFLTF